MIWIHKIFRQNITKERINDLLLRFFGILGFSALIVLSTHQSKHPVVFGIYSIRYALLLLGVVVVSTCLIVVSIPRLRQRLLRRPERVVPRRLAWALVIGGWVALLVSFVLLRTVLPIREENELTTSFILLSELAVMGGIFWRLGLGELRLSHHWLNWSIPIFILIMIPVLTVFHGRLPEYRLVDELLVSGTAWKQAHEPSAFVNLTADRNAQTWANFSMLWPVVGLYMRLFGAGWVQARAFYLFLLFLASPFIYGVTHRLYGRVAAVCAALLSIAIPIHHNWSLSHGYVATATAIALYSYVRSKSSKKQQHLWLLFCGFFALSTVEGHYYGLAVAAMFGLLQLQELYVSWRQNNFEIKNTAALLFGFVFFFILWYYYHVSIPNINPSDLPEIILNTYAWEDARGENFSPYILWKSFQLYSFINPFELVILLIGVLLALLRFGKQDRLLLTILFGSMILVSLVLAHINDFKFVFFMPFVCILGGAVTLHVRRSIGQGKNVLTPSLHILLLYLVVSMLLLFTFQVYAVSNRTNIQARLLEQQERAEIGRTIDSLLPKNEIVIAGDSGYFTGMHHRLNYWATFSFTWKLPKYWPLDPPQAIIVTLGWDDGYSGLAEWLVNHYFQAIECYSIKKARNEAYAAILYALPELELSQTQGSCTPELLGWLNSD